MRISIPVLAYILLMIFSFVSCGQNCTKERGGDDLLNELSRSEPADTVKIFITGWIQQDIDRMRKCWRSDVWESEGYDEAFIKDGRLIKSLVEELGITDRTARESAFIREFLDISDIRPITPEEEDSLRKYDPAVLEGGPNTIILVFMMDGGKAWDLVLKYHPENVEREPFAKGDNPCGVYLLEEINGEWLIYGLLMGY